MQVSSFLTPENLNLIWDVIMENKVYQNKPKDFYQKINLVFNENINGFYKQETKNQQPISLLDLNKKFIYLFNQHINQVILPNFIPNPIKPPSTENILREEIYNDRLQKFENNLHLAKQDFTNAMAIPIPPTPEFKDKMDFPLSDLEIEIKKTIAQRNYDLEKFPPNRNKLDSNWLNSQQTSIKNEKIGLNKVTSADSIKYIKIEDTNLDKQLIKKDIIELTPYESNHFKKEKHISWALEENNLLKEENILLEEENENLFKKFKKITPDQDLEPIESGDKIENLEKRIKKIELMMENIFNILKIKD